MQQSLHVFGYLKKKPKLSLFMDFGLPNIDYTDFKLKRDDFKEIVRKLHESGRSEEASDLISEILSMNKEESNLII